MPITKSAKKSLRSSIAKFKRNDSLRKNLEIKLKKVTAENFSQVVSTVDKAAKKNIIHKNKAARIKSQLAKMVDLKKITKRPGSGVTAAKSAKAVKKTAAKKPAAKKTAKKA